jgi:hypothetical protein
MTLPRVAIELLEIAVDGSDEETFEGEAFTGIAIELGPAGQAIAEVPYRFGKYHGPQREWDESGRLREEEYFNRGVRHGVARAWDEQGRVTRDEIWEFFLRTYTRLPAPDDERGVCGWLAEDDPAMLERWRAHRASMALHPIIELLDNEFFEVPWPFDDQLPEALRRRLIGAKP